MADRVRFEKPPVIEVVCGTLFSILPGFRVAHVGRFWDLVKGEFPVADEAPPLEPIVEGLGGRPLFAFELELGPIPPAPRTWLRAKDESALIQIQRDRFLYNWKRSADDAPYPSYDQVIVDFERHLASFSGFVSREGLGDLSLRQLELTYVNHIPINDVPANEPVFVDHTRDNSRERFLPIPENFSWRSSYALPDQTGRLHVNIHPARAVPSGEPLIRMDMTARGMRSDGDVRRWFDLAHEWIVRGFTDVTTRHMQEKVWRRLS